MSTEITNRSGYPHDFARSREVEKFRNLKGFDCLVLRYPPIRESNGDAILWTNLLPK